MLSAVCLLSGGYLGYDAVRFPHDDTSDHEVGAALTIDGQRARGLRARMFVSTEGCDNPARVAVLLEATAGFWAKHRAKVADRRLVMGKRVTDVTTARLAVSVTAADTARPVLYQASVEDVIDNLYVRERAGHRPSQELFGASAFRSVAGYWVGEAELRAWPATHTAVVIDFEANWLKHRSPGTCNLALPSLTGPGPGRATRRAERHLDQRIPVRRIAPGVVRPVSSNAIVAAGDVVLPGDGVIDIGSSVPPPNILDFGGRVGWRCLTPAHAPHTLTFSGARVRIYHGEPLAGPAPVDGTQGGRPTDCSAQLVIQTGGKLRDGELILAGFLLPSALVFFLYDSVLDLVRRRRRALWVAARRQGSRLMTRVRRMLR